MKIVEIFSSIQGEGLLIGTPSVFVRVGRCQLRCVECDTDFDRFDELPVDEVATRVLGMPESHHVVITGGEPLLWQHEVAELIRRLQSIQGAHVTVETNGAIPFGNHGLEMLPSLFSYSPKVGSLGRDQRFSWRRVIENIAITETSWQIKYVLDPLRMDDAERIRDFQGQLEKRTELFNDQSVIFQPLDRGTVVGQIVRVRDFIFADYAEDLSRLQELVSRLFPGRGFRVLPQLHKLMIASGGLTAERASAVSRMVS